MKDNSFCKAYGRKYWRGAEIITYLGKQDVPGWAFVSIGPNTFSGMRLSELRKLVRA